MHLRRRPTRLPSLPVQLVAVLLVLLLDSFDGHRCEGASSGKEEQDLWADNVSNGTELCSGVIDVNSTELIYSYPSLGNISHIPCSVDYAYHKERCDVHNYVTLTTDEVSYVDAYSVIVASVESNATRDHDKLYYKLCHAMYDSSNESEVVECVSNGTTMVSEYRWRKTGEVVLTVYVYTNSSFNDSDYLDCGTTEVTVASEYGLNLTVKLLNEPFHLDEGTEVYYGAEDVDEEGPLFILGNVTFATVANLLSGITEGVTYYYNYAVSGPLCEEGVCSHHPNWTRAFAELGEYNYTIHAIAKLDNIGAHHANITGGFKLLEGLSETVMQVGSNNSVKVGTKEQLSITAEGSTPITVCWFQTKVQTKEETNLDPAKPSPTPLVKGPTPPLPPPLPPEDRHLKKNRSALPLRDCVILNNSNATVFRENRTFNVVGTFQYVAHFSNGASQVERNFTFHVFSGTSPTFVASGATAIVVFAVLVALVVVIVALVAGGYIPYRRYKNRMTETADFRFVDLSDNGTPWDRFKLKANQFMDNFRTKRHNEKIGLVNLGAVPISEERRLFYGTNTLTQFAPYETL